MSYSGLRMNATFFPGSVTVSVAFFVGVDVRAPGRTQVKIAISTVRSNYVADLLVRALQCLILVAARHSGPLRQAHLCLRHWRRQDRLRLRSPVPTYTGAGRINSGWNPELEGQIPGRACMALRTSSTGGKSS